MSDKVLRTDYTSIAPFGSRVQSAPWRSGGLVSKSPFLAAPSVPGRSIGGLRLLHSSPVRSVYAPEPQVPDYGAYEQSESAGRALSYVVVGATGVISFAATKAFVGASARGAVVVTRAGDFVKTMAASADVLALAKAEIELGNMCVRALNVRN